MHTEQHGRCPHNAVTSCVTGVLFAGRADGVLEAWDLLDRSHEPVLVTAACTAAVTSLAFSLPPLPHAKGPPTQQLLAVGEAYDSAL